MSVQTIRIPVVTGINAGRGVPDDYTDWAITGFRDVRVIADTDQFSKFIAVPVDGDSLIEQAILDGDILICKITSDYEVGKIGLWQTPSGRTAKFATYDVDGFIVLHNDSGWRQTWNASEIKLLGLVVRSERDFT